MKNALLGILLPLLMLCACNISVPDAATPTLRASAAPSATLSPTASPSPIPPPPSATLSPTASPSPTLPPPTATAVPPSPTPTLGPFEYTVRESDTLLYILQLPQHGYSYELEVAETVVALNDSIVSMDIMPVGSTILIPRPTAASAQSAQPPLATLAAEDTARALLPASALVGCYEVEEGDSIIDIATDFNTTLEILSQLNQDLNWFGCAFTEQSGGPDCNPTIQIGQCIQVPQPTPLPSRTPTPTGSETPTPTPTYAPPRVVYPPGDARVPPGALTLQWLAVSGMRADGEYLIELQNEMTGALVNQVTQTNAYAVPGDLAPPAGETHRFRWRISIAARKVDGSYAYAGSPGIWQAFEWTGR